MTARQPNDLGRVPRSKELYRRALEIIPGGTQLVKDIRPGSQSSFPFDLTNVGGTLFFVADDGVHNGELIMKSDGSPALPVAYDFDFSGAVNAPYATVDPRLPVKYVRQRLFRGYCVLAPHYPAAIALFQQKKAAIYALYADAIGKLLDPQIVKETLEYFDEFYDTIKSPRDAERGLLSSCVGPR